MSVGTNKTLKRSAVVGMIITALFLVLVLRILVIQTFKYDVYQSKVINQMTTELTVKAKRGNIYDRNGNILATDMTAYNLIISPKAIQYAGSLRTDDLDQVSLVAEGISEMLGEEYYDSVVENSKHTTKLYRSIKKNIPDDSGEGDDSVIDKLNKFIAENELYNQVYLEQTSIRYYPYGSLGSHIIGFCGADGNGLYGIERSYNHILAGTDGKKVTARDAHGNEMVYDYESYIAAVDGCDVYTTIDVEIQKALDEQCYQSLINTGARNRTCGIVMEPDTGAILAMSTAPAFDLNDPFVLVDYYQEKLDDYVKKNNLYTENGEVDTDSELYDAKRRALFAEMWQNKPISDAYIPGSTFKIITSAMALDDKVVTDPYATDSRFTCVSLDGTKLGGSREAAGVLMHCHSLHNSQCFAEGLMNSCNVTFISLGLGIGKDSFYSSFDKFGYLDKTGIDLPDEGRSIMHTYEGLGTVELATSAFGQNFKITGIQHITAVNAVVNGGTLYKPFTVFRAVDKNGNTVFEQDPTVVRQVASKEVCETLRVILEECVSGGYGGKNCYVPGYRVAAKTGTSEKVGDDRDGILGKDLRIGSVMAFAPSEAPVATAFFMCDEPDPKFGSTYGSTVAAPYMQSLMEEILPYMSVDPIYTESEKDNLMVKVPNFEGWSIEYLQKHFAEYYPDVDFPTIVGTGKYIASQQPAAGTYVVDGKLNLHLYTSLSEERANTAKVPDVKGKTAAAAIQILINRGFNVTVSGKSYYEDVTAAVVTGQSVAPDTELIKGSTVELYFDTFDSDDANGWWTHEGDDKVYG
ncbi:MAG: PASTA domain-containing protein [Ruminococcaceae bacterium]|nr:PASTA domain-containing protein [Oscillospiraceae bacterium]